MRDEVTVPPELYAPIGVNAAVTSPFAERSGPEPLPLTAPCTPPEYCLLSVVAPSGCIVNSPNRLHGPLPLVGPDAEKLSCTDACP